MDLRLLLMLTLAGCADPNLEPSLGLAPAAAPPMAVTPVSAPVVVQATAPPPVVSGDLAFDTWLYAFRGRALAAGLSPQLLDRELAGLTPDPRAAALDGKQPEFSKPVGDYVKGTVSDVRVTQGRQFRHAGESLVRDQYSWHCPFGCLICFCLISPLGCKALYLISPRNNLSRCVGNAMLGRMATERALSRCAMD